MVDENKIHNLCLSEDPKERIKGLRLLEDNYYWIPDKNRVSEDLHRLVNDNNSNVRSSAAFTLIKNFPRVTNKQEAWNDLNRLLDDTTLPAMRDLKSSFHCVPDKETVWQYYIHLSYDESSNNRDLAVSTLNTIITYVKNKNEAWKDLFFLIKDNYSINHDEDRYVMWVPEEILKSVFIHIPDKVKAWEDLLLLLKEDIIYPLSSVLITIFNEHPDKYSAWKKLIEELVSEDCTLNNSQIRGIIEELFPNIVSIFVDIKDKNEAWKDILTITKKYFSDNNISQKETNHMLNVLVSVFALLPNKTQAWTDLILLLKEERKEIKYISSLVIVLIFCECPNKKLAWRHIIQAAIDEECLLMTDQLKNVFCLTTDQSSAWMDITQLSSHGSIKVRLWTAEVIRSLFIEISDKNQALDILLQLAQDIDPTVRNHAADGIKSIFNFVEDKNFVWDELIKAISRNDLSTKKSLLIICKSVFSKLSNKTQARGDLFRLAIQDEAIKVDAMKVFGSSLDQLHKETDLDDAIDLINDILIEKKGTSNEIARSNLEEIINLLEKVREVSQENSREMKDISINITEVKENTKEIKVKVDKIEQILDNIRFDIFKVKLNSGDVVSKLEILKKELEKVNKIENLNTLSIENLDFVQAEKLNGLNKDILERMEEIKVLIDRLPKSDDTQEFNVELNELKQSRSDMLLQKSSAIISLIGFAMQILQCRPV